MKSIWYYFIDDSVTKATEVIRHLIESGFDTKKLEPNTPPGMGIVFFHKFSNMLCDLLRDISRNGMNRVLAITNSSDGLNNFNPWILLQSGASDVFNLDCSVKIAEKIVARFNQWISVDQLLESSLVRNNLIGQSLPWLSVLREIIEVAYYTDSSMLITGESGTGKELIARLIHTLDQRANKGELIILDCTTIVPELSGSEFFGHEKGAFTGAMTSRDGAFALAKDGTLFLDEVSELPLKLQAQLLRAIQERTFKRVGGNTWHSTNFRLLCATNKDLMEQVKRGEFRSDLYYRIANWKCKLPPLRDRQEDILLLAYYFIKAFIPDGEEPVLDRSVRDFLLGRDYPGNVRDLKSVVSRIVSRCPGKGLITIGDIPEDERPKGEPGIGSWNDVHFDEAIRRALLLDTSLREIRRMAEDTAIRIAINEESGILSRAAKRLGVTARALEMRRANERRRKQIIN